MDGGTPLSSAGARNDIAVYVLVCLLLVAALGSFYVFRATNPVHSTSGVLLLSLAERNRAETRQYRLDVATGVLREESRGSEIIFVQNRYGNIASFIGTSDAEIAAFGDDLNSALQVYRAKVGSNGFENVEKLTSVSQDRKRAPDISPGGYVLYSALTEDSASESKITTAEEWGVFLAGSEGPELISTGLYPQWVNDDLFIVLKNDGIHLLSISDERDELVWELAEGKALSNMMLHLSENKETIAWTAPDAGALYIARVASWTPLNVDGDSIAVHGFWPVASPDGSQVAIQAVDWNAVETNPRPRIIIYDVATLAEVGKVVNLNRFDQERMFVSDWIQI